MQNRTNQFSSLKTDGLHKKRIYERFFKRPMDFILSAFAIILFSPILLTVSYFVRIKLGSPILFKQERPGLNEKIFTMYKFRTMTEEKDESGQLLPDNIRLTKFGRMLRSTSLDELPELFNIIKGEMSIVGPRPLLVQYLPLYNTHQKRRHDVRPGLTGLAQVNGRNSISWDDRFSYDVKYVNNLTFAMDLRIILATIRKVVGKEGISSNTSVTMEAFHGNKEGNYQ